ncbi:sigma 54-interacting transcriptional regulator [Pseudorhodoferax soli]|uniref:sigma 54-interacting transcriptional regulator n=1 Tax=Pseudorhodoferax soli TaxID=545864 RepID=UPI0011C069D2|nr:sigma 54-interacting transcriptional regulator [Pseudorhodoferax soli]
MAADRAARQLLGLAAGPPSAKPFEQLFSVGFGAWMSALRHARQGAAMRLADGVRLRAVAMEMVQPAARTAPLQLRAATPSAQAALSDELLVLAYDRGLRVASVGLPILVTGETGTSKEVAARALHAAGPSAAGPLVALNCAAIPGELLAGDLFGYVDGTFTGTRRGRAPGKIEGAHGSTHSLGEVGDMPLALQVSLLHLLDSFKVVRPACMRARPVDVHLVCASHRGLPVPVRQGSRGDLI